MVTAKAKLGEGDDGNYGSAATRDIECLQAISRRIHCGSFFLSPPLLPFPPMFSCFFSTLSPDFENNAKGWE
jgi:chorismate mutase